MSPLLTCLFLDRFLAFRRCIVLGQQVEVEIVVGLEVRFENILFKFGYIVHSGQNRFIVLKVLTKLAQFGIPLQLLCYIIKFNPQFFVINDRLLFFGNYAFQFYLRIDFEDALGRPRTPSDLLCAAHQRSRYLRGFSRSDQHCSSQMFPS